MQAIEFEADYAQGVLSIPRNIESKIKNHHLKIIMMYDNKKMENAKVNFDSGFLNMLRNGPKASFEDQAISREWIHGSGEENDLYR